MVKISLEWVTGPQQGKSSGRIATFSLWTGVFRDGICKRVFVYILSPVHRSWQRLQINIYKNPQYIGVYIPHFSKHVRHNITVPHTDTILVIVKSIGTLKMSPHFTCLTLVV